MRPGSAAWLLRHECRLLWITALAATDPAGNRRTKWRFLGGALGVWLLLHLGVLALLRRVGAMDGQFPHVLVAISAALLVNFLFMLSSALKASVHTLFDRGDMDLLLSSPLPSRSIFTVKLSGMTAGLAARYLFFLAPFAHVGLLLGQPRWLAVYPLVLAMAALASSSAMLLTLALVRLIGARRARVVAQVVGALAGALLFLLSQAGTLLARDDDGAAPPALTRLMALAAHFDPSSPLLLPARAALGNASAVAIIAAAGALAAVLTVHLTHRFFAHGLQQAAGIGASTRVPGKLRHRFGRSLAAAVIAKEWRCIARDPHLVSQVLLQLLYLLPLCFIIFGSDTLQLPAIGAGLTMLCGSLGGALAWIVLLAEDAPDLLGTAPARMALVKRAKLAAAILPVLALAALPVLWLTLRAPLAGIVTAISVGGAVASAALITAWTGRPRPRGEFSARNQRNVATGLLEACNQLAWGALAFLPLYASGPGQMDGAVSIGTSAAAAIALGILLVAWMRGRAHRA